MKTSNFLASVIGGAVAVGGLGQTVAVNRPSAPKIEFAEIAHDFGKIEAGQTMKYSFVFTNTGNATLTITEVRPGCGCTTAGAWDKTVEPGKTGTIPLQFNSTGFNGPISKAATVTCNDPARSNLVLQLKGTVWRPVDLVPSNAYFSLSSESPTNETRVVRIVSNLDESLTLSPPECPNEAFRAELTTVKPGKEFEVRITATPPTGADRVQGTVTLKTSSSRVPVLSIPVYAYVQPVVVVAPTQLSLPAGPVAAAVRPSVTIRNTGTNNLVLSDAAVTVAGATVEVKELQPGKVFTLAVNVPAGTDLKPGQAAELSVKSSHPKFPVIRVPITQYARPQTPAPPPAPRPGVVRSGPPAPPPLLARPSDPGATAGGAYTGTPQPPPPPIQPRPSAPVPIR